jgi:hypothetical protein
MTSGMTYVVESSPRFSRIETSGARGRGRRILCDHDIGGIVCGSKLGDRRHDDTLLLQAALRGAFVLSDKWRYDGALRSRTDPHAHGPRPTAGHARVGFLLHDLPGSDFVVGSLVLLDAKREITVGKHRRGFVDRAPDERGDLHLPRPQRDSHRCAEKHQESHAEGAHHDEELAEAPDA